MTLLLHEDYITVDSEEISIFCGFLTHRAQLSYEQKAYPYLSPIFSNFSHICNRAVTIDEYYWDALFRSALRFYENGERKRVFNK